MFFQEFQLYIHWIFFALYSTLLFLSLYLVLCSWLFSFFSSISFTIFSWMHLLGTLKISFSFLRRLLLLEVQSWVWLIFVYPSPLLWPFILNGWISNLRYFFHMWIWWFKIFKSGWNILDEKEAISSPKKFLFTYSISSHNIFSILFSLSSFWNTQSLLRSANRWLYECRVLDDLVDFLILEYFFFFFLRIMKCSFFNI